MDSAYWQGLPSADLESQISSVHLFLGKRSTRFRLSYMVCITFLHLVSIFLGGKTFNKMSNSRKEALIDRLIASRNPIVCGVPVFLSLPYLKSFFLDQMR